MIPLEGARVKVKSGKDAGKLGHVAVVYDARDMLKMLSRHEGHDLSRTQRARMGSTWIDRWYMADVQLDDGRLLTLEWTEITVLDISEVRPNEYRKA